MVDNVLNRICSACFEKILARKSSGDHQAKKYILYANMVLK
jgi:hypothetical protein